MKQVILLIGSFVAAGLAPLAQAKDVELVKAGKEALPIVVSNTAPVSVKRAAEDLSQMIGKISGVTPPVVNSLPENATGAIWVGFNDQLSKLFSGTDFSWKHPEEILILGRGQNIAILGRDRQAGDTETEAGTANAVYAFAQKYLGVRWLWPGALGADYPSHSTISLPEMEYRFHPIFVQRAVFRFLSDPVPNSDSQWYLFQHIYYDSFNLPVGHAFSAWWDKYSQEHPEYFALQPDGTRGTFPERPTRKKLCEGEPAVWQKWLDEASEQLEANPNLNVLNASPNDSSNSGICVDPRSRAWDHPDGKLWRYEWAGTVKEEPAMTNRYLTFWNTLAGMLKEKYPDKEVFVYGMAYGPSKPPPIDLKVADNVAIGYVGHLPMIDDKRREEERAEIREWGKLTKNLFFRPNLALYSGGFHAIPAVTFKNTISDFRFLAENGVRGIIIDTLPDHWGTQGPMYYLMAQLAWDPLQDGEAVLTDYYQRGFGPAAQKVQAYFNLMEKAHEAILNRPDWIHSGRMARPLSEFMIAEAYTPEVLAQARTLLKEAATLVKNDRKYSDRVAFFSKGLDFTEKLIATMDAMNRVRDSKGRDLEAVEEAQRLIAEREAFFEKENAAAKKSGEIAPISARRFNITYARTRSLLDHVGPVSEAFLKAAAAEKANPTWVKPVAAPSKNVPAADGTEFRWTGKSRNKLWATPGNWEVKTGSNWALALNPPGPGSTVYLGDEADPQQRQLNLSANTDVARLVITTKDAAGYVIQTRPDADTEGLDSDSGMLFTLTLTDPSPIAQEAATKGDLSIRSKVAFTGAKNPLILVSSTSGAAVRLEGQIVSGSPAEKRAADAAKGKLVINLKTEK